MLLSKYIWNGFNYFDELLTIICLTICVLNILKYKKIIIIKKYNKMVYILLLILLVGLIGNYISKVQTNLIVILLDILATFKSFIIYYTFKKKFTNSEQNIKTIHSIANIFRIYILICTVFAILNHFINIGMHSGYDFGIKNFMFIFEGAGNYALPFYVISFTILIDVAMKEIITLFDIVIIIFMFFVWSASLTTRSLAYTAIFFCMYIMNKLSKKGKLKIWQILIIAVVSILIGFSTILYYFSTERNTARGALLRYSVVVFKRYFPFGAGFATYASNMAAEYYSKLYDEFGFNYIFGLAKENPVFANDSFWPEIIGQFGFIGLVLAIILLILFYRNIINLNSSKSEKLILQWIFFVFLIGSTGTKTYIHFVTTGFYIILALYENTKNKQKLLQI